MVWKCSAAISVYLTNKKTIAGKRSILRFTCLFSGNVSTL